MRDKAIRFIEENDLLCTNDKVIVALSGGADSVALLYFLNSIKEKYNLTVYAAHLNHNLRGEESKRDENFVKNLCEKLSVEFFLKSLDIKDMAKTSKQSEELCGREQRYLFFDELSKKLSAKVATAHNATDNAETVLYNLCRGSSLKGVCGIPKKRDNVIRPLLCVSRDEIERYCDENNLEYVTDSTNLEDKYNRNKIRHNAISTLKEINPNFENAVLRFCKSMEQSCDFLSEIAKKELKSAKTEYGYSCEKLLSLDKAVLSFALMQIIKDNNADAENKHIEIIISAMKSGGSVDLPNGYTCVCSQNTLRIIKNDKTSADCLIDKDRVESSAIELPFCECEDAEYYSKEELKNINKKLANELIDCDIINCGTVIRHKKAGDLFTLSNRKVTKPLRKLMIEMKIPKEIRDDLLVVANGSTILWVEKIGVSLQGKISQSTTKAVRILKNKQRGKV